MYPRPGNYRKQPPAGASPSNVSPNLQQRNKFGGVNASTGGYPSFASTNYANTSTPYGGPAPSSRSGSYSNGPPVGYGQGPGPAQGPGYGHGQAPMVSGGVPGAGAYGHPSYPPPHHSGGGMNGIPVQNDQNKTVANKIREDCYNKFINDNGNQVREVSYIHHIEVKEFSQFTASPPPSNLPNSQMGSIKDRVLVVCSKFSGRVLLQKGKYNDQKKQYQIGRTWDLDELKVITKAGSDGFILSLNKEYYWKCDQGNDKLHRFIRNLTKTYSNFMGKYPLINGWSVSDFDLPEVPVKKNFASTPTPDEVINPQPDAQLLKSKSLKRKNLPNPILPVQPQSRQGSQSSFNQVPQLPQMSQIPQTSQPQYNSQSPQSYQDRDFGSNGKQPMKPMKVLNRSADASQTSLPESAVSINESPVTPTYKSHPYKSITPAKSETEMTNDSQSFIFNPLEEDPTPQKLPKQRGSRSSANNQPRADSRNFSEPLETTAALNMQLAEQLSKPPQIVTRFSSDFGIEEVDDTENEKSQAEDTEDIERADDSDDLVEVSQSTKDIGAIDSSIQEIEAFMDSQLNFGGKKERTGSELLKPRLISDSMALDSSDADISDDKSFSMTENEIDTVNTQEDIESDLNINKRTEVLQQDKDAEVEELLDELQWDLEDDADTLVKKLTGELNKLKYNNVKQLINLDFSGDSMKEDLSTSLNEIENIDHIFKRMEIEFKALGTDINIIENNSQGLQIKAVNKKLLYNDLKSILDKVSMSARDLMSIENFTEFDRINKLPTIELQVQNLHNALETIRQDQTSFDEQSSSQLTSMNSLKQYLSNYEAVGKKFVANFLQFFWKQFSSRMDQLNSLDRIYPKSVLVELNSLTIYSPFTYFLKEFSPSEFTELKNVITSKLSGFLEKLLKARIKSVKYSDSSALTPNIPTVSKFDTSDSMSLKKSRTLRLSSRKDKLIGKLGLGDDSNPTSPKNSNPSSPNPNTDANQTSLFAKGIEDTKTIVDLVNDTRDLSIVVTNFVGQLLHYENDIHDLNEYMNASPFETRVSCLDQTTIDMEMADYSGELITLLNSIFGNYSNLFIKKIIPVDYNIPIILIYLETLSNESHKLNHDFFVFNFLKKVLDKYRNNWTKFVKTQIDSLNKSSISAKSGILSCIKNANQLIHLTETTLDKPSRLYGDLDDSNVKALLNKSYKDIIEAAIHLFVKDDPLLKNSEFDEKEKNHRNVSILQNIFSMLEQLVLFNNERTMKAKGQLETVFKRVQDTYFNKLLTQNIGKIVEFVNNFEAMNDSSSKAKKYNKKTVKTILSGYSSKELGVRVGEIRRKLEKHFLSGNNMFEKDLLDKLWSDMEKRFVNYFFRLDNILSKNYGDIEFHISKQEIHSIFRSLT